MVCLNAMKTGSVLVPTLLKRKWLLLKSKNFVEELCSQCHSPCSVGLGCFPFCGRGMKDIDCSYDQQTAKDDSLVFIQLFLLFR